RMYVLTLILRYLRRKLAPMFAVLAVTLCTAMVVIVVSVFGGFLNLLGDSVRRITSDVTITADLSGLPHYQELMDRLAKLPEVAGTTTMVQTYGLIRIENLTQTVEIYGVEPPAYDRVTGFKNTLYWTSQRLSDSVLEYFDELGPDLPPEVKEQRDRVLTNYREHDFRDYAMDFTVPPGWREDEVASTSPPGPAKLPGTLPGALPGADGAILGIEVSPYHQRDDHGQYSFNNSPLRAESTREITVTVLPLTRQGAVLEPAVRRFTVVNESKSGLYEIDKNRIYVPLAVLQRMLRMDEHKRFDPETGQETNDVIPARASLVMVKAAPGISSEALKQKVEQVAAAVEAENPDMPRVWVQTWRESYGSLLSAIENEKLLTTLLFVIVSVVAFAMIGVVFYMIVLEKTRDIGVMRALGASRSGIASIFLGYGLVIGVIGSLLGLLLACAVVWNINEIQAFLGRTVGFVMWNPKVYYFDRIPNQINTHDLTWIIPGAMAASLLGALVPAILAARLDPVESLRYE
ncbi:MAG: FtsX-like permease family protein, partial [Phycisphaeraceae bacterium]|nr:FtsX-like permease family protein [Phycisphaeraceae bacterium]